MTGKTILELIADTLTQVMGTTLGSLFGPQVHRSILGTLSIADLVAFGLLLLIVLLINGVAAGWLRKQIRRAESNSETMNWKSRLLQAAGKPLYLLIWIYGFYVAAWPLLKKLPNQESGETHPVQALFAGLLNFGVFVVLLWAAFRATRVLEAGLRHWAGRTEGRLDDLLVPLLGRSLRVLVPVLGIIFALPATGLSHDSSVLVARGSSILVILTVAWILIQAISVAEKAVLLKYDIGVADNLSARKVYTQVHVLAKAAYVLVAIFTAASVLMLFEDVRRFGTSLLASAGVIGIIVGFAAQRTIANLFAGFQLALTQPIRLDDVVIVEGEWGRIEEITLTYVVVKIWDDRRLIVPLSHFIEKPFQNWTRSSAQILGSVFVWADYSLSVQELRPVIGQIVANCADWDKRFWNVQVTDTNERAMQLRVLATAADASKAWDLRCEIREKLLDYLQARKSESLPKLRTEISQLSAVSAL